MKPFIPKEDERLPDAWGIKITYATGRVEEFEGTHNVYKETGTLEILTMEDKFFLLPIQNILKIEFDNRFSRFVHLKKEKENAISPVRAANG